MNEYINKLIYIHIVILQNDKQPASIVYYTDRYQKHGAKHAQAHFQCYRALVSVPCTCAINIFNRQDGTYPEISGKPTIHTEQQ
jgi:hypothetical protein